MFTRRQAIGLGGESFVADRAPHPSPLAPPPSPLLDADLHAVNVLEQVALGGNGTLLDQQFTRVVGGDDQLVALSLELEVAPCRVVPAGQASARRKMADSLLISTRR